jgi:uncharacterized protein
MISRRWFALAGALLVAPWGSTPQAGSPPPGYEKEIQQWRERRVARLQSDTGWLTVAGLFWLHPGDNTFGTEPGNDILLPSGSAPGRAGVFVHADGITTVRANPGTELHCDGRQVSSLVMRTDNEDSTDVVELGRLSFYVILRGDRYGIRMRDKESPMRQKFHGIEAWPVDPAYRLEARFEPYEPPRTLPIPTILGTVDSMLCSGALVFELDGKTYRLDPVLESPEDTSLFIIFSDETSGDETYGAGRFLYADLPENGKTIVDFNKAYNPPCAFTPYATCPLPPPQNELPVAVRAGEKKYDEH